MTFKPIPGFMPDLVHRARIAINSDIDGFKGLEGHEHRVVAANLIRERWEEMTREAKERPRLLDREKEIAKLGPAIASWRLVALAHALHVLNKGLDDSIEIHDVEGNDVEMLRAADLIRGVSMTTLKPDFVGKSLILDAAAARLISSNLLEQGWRGAWKAEVSAGTQDGRTLVSVVLTWETGGMPSLIGGKATLHKNLFVLFDMTAFDEHAKTDLYHLCTHASAEAWLHNRAAIHRNQGESLTLQAAQQFDVARKLTAAARGAVHRQPKSRAE